MLSTIFFIINLIHYASCGTVALPITLQSPAVASSPIAGAVPIATTSAQVLDTHTPISGTYNAVEEQALNILNNADIYDDADRQRIYTLVAELLDTHSELIYSDALHSKILRRNIELMRNYMLNPEKIVDTLVMWRRVNDLVAHVNELLDRLRAGSLRKDARTSMLVLRDAGRTIDYLVYVRFFVVPALIKKRWVDRRLCMSIDLVLTLEHVLLV